MPTMMALRAHARGGPEELVYEPAPVPTPGPGEALVAGRMAKRRGLSPRGWRLQTLIVGFPSLRTLRRTARPA